MEKTLGAAVASFPSSNKAIAHAAFVDLKESHRTVLGDCFRQFGIESVAITRDAANVLRQQKFEACVLRLTPGAEAVMEAARTSPSNSRMVIYGMGGSALDAMRFSKFGINAIFHEPLDRSAALKLVRATRGLVRHEFRRYVRIPVMTEVSVVCADGRRFSATSLEVSSGGMSLKSSENIGSDQAIEVSFALLTLPRLWIRGSASWKNPKGSFGVRFDLGDERRARLKEWIDAYIES